MQQAVNANVLSHSLALLGHHGVIKIALAHLQVQLSQQVDAHQINLLGTLFKDVYAYNHLLQQVTFINNLIWHHALINVWDQLENRRSMAHGRTLTIREPSSSTMVLKTIMEVSKRTAKAK
jgi:hypothetical protein